MEEHQDLQDLRVLIVDNDQSYRHLMATMLRSIGISEIGMAGNADEARAEIAAASLDYLLLDRTLEGGKGFVLVRYLRDPQTTPAPHLPVIMTTDERKRTHITAAIKAGADHILVKPISPAELAATFRNLAARPPEKIEVRTYIGPCRRRLPEQLYDLYAGEDRRRESVAVAARG
ncbi:MAG: response regulator [Alphaproteobacteria bacterium]|nr:response regulator [Alphaproteobacteria bacterium]